MIKVKQTRKGIGAEVRGYKSEILAELSTLIKGLIDRETATKEEILKCVEVATMSEEELDKAIQEKQEEFRKMVDEILQKGFDLTKANKGVELVHEPKAENNNKNKKSAIKTKKTGNK